MLFVILFVLECKNKKESGSFSKNDNLTMILTLLSIKDHLKVLFGILRHIHKIPFIESTVDSRFNDLPGTSGKSALNRMVIKSKVGIFYAVQ